MAGEPITWQEWGFSLPPPAQPGGKTGVCSRLPVWGREGTEEDPEAYQTRRGLPCEVLPGQDLPFPNSGLCALRVLWAVITVKDKNPLRPLCLFSRANETKYRRRGGLKEQKIIVSQLWSLEVQNQGVGRVLPSELCEGRMCPRPLSLACWGLSSHYLLSSCVSGPKFLLIRTPVILD